LIKAEYIKNKMPNFSFWNDTRMVMPEGAPEVWKNVFTGKDINISSQTPLQEVFNKFPVILLHARKE
jgi:maltooligosyltrehalose synthase